MVLSIVLASMVLVNVSAGNIYNNRADTKAVAKWTFMVFINGDNDLSDAGNEDRQEMEVVGSSADVNIVVEQGWYTVDTTIRWYVQKGYSDTVEVLGDLDMGDPNTIADFAIWAITNYPAEKYALIIWDHGSGWYKGDDSYALKGISYDDESSTNVSIAKGELDTLLVKIKNFLGRNLDLLGMDACLMGMQEVDYQARKYVDVIVHSEETEPWDGWPYVEILDTLVKNPYMTPAEFGAVIAKLYIDSYSGGSQGTSNVTMSAISLNSIDYNPYEANKYIKYLRYLDNFARALIEVGGRDNTAVSTARSNTIEYYYADNIDLYDFVYNVKLQNISDTINTLADSLMYYIDKVVEYGADNYSGQSHGIAIYYPSRLTGQITNTYLPYYYNLEFAQNYSWYDFIGGASSIADIRATVLHLGDFTFDDLSNHNGLIGANETVEIYPAVENSGSATAASVVVTASTDDPYVTIVDASATVGDIPAGEMMYSTDPVAFSVASYAPVGHSFTITLTLSSAKVVETQTLYFVVGETAPTFVDEDVYSGVENLPNIMKTGEFTITLSPDTRENVVTIYRIDGRKVKDIYRGIPADGARITVSLEKPGIYFIVERTGKGVNTKKVIVVR